MNVYCFHPIRHFCKNQGLNHIVGTAGACSSGKEHRKETNHINVWQYICSFIEKNPIHIILQQNICLSTGPMNKLSDVMLRRLARTEDVFVTSPIFL